MQSCLYYCICTVTIVESLPAEQLNDKPAKSKLTSSSGLDNVLLRQRIAPSRTLAALPWSTTEPAAPRKSK